MQTNQTKTYLFQMTIPSVQKFISASRKSADLWAGSLIVSYLMKKLLNKVINDENIGNKIQLIYPYTDNSFDEKETTANTPNVAIFIVKDIEKDKADKLKNILQDNSKNLINRLAEFGVERFFKEEIKNEDIIKAFSKEKLNKVRNKINEIKNNKESYKELAKYQIKETLKLFVDYLELESNNSSEEEDLNQYYNYKDTSQDLADIVNYAKKSQLPDRDYIENFELIEPFEWKYIRGWNNFYGFERNNKFKTGTIKGVYRCSSCGEHTIIGADLEDWRGNSVWKPLWEANPKYFNRGERLCGVCLAKRYFRDYFYKKYKDKINYSDLGFPSTSEISATLFKKEILNKAKNNLKLVQMLENFRKAFFNIPNFEFEKIQGNPVKSIKDKTKDILPTCFEKCCYCSMAIDGEWFIEDIWKNKNDYEVIGADDKKANQMLNLLGQIYSFLKSRGVEKHYKPSEYYAVILLDGDSIGKKLDKIKNSENPIKTHQNFSANLSKLSKRFKNIVEKYDGALIYSGGDDVLALVPVERALDCAYRIQGVYSRYLRCKYKDIHSESPFTMSGSIIYAHHKLPLSYILDEARKCEEKAKEEGRNRVCLKYIKRSLASAEALFEWENIIYIYDFIKSKSLYIPKTLIYDLIQINQVSQLDTLSSRNLNDVRLRENLIKFLLKNKVSKSQVEDFLDLFWKIDNNYKFIKIVNTLKILTFQN